MKKTALIFLTLFLCLLCSCGEKEQNDDIQGQTQQVVRQSVNYLTGQQSDEYTENAPRPVAVTVNNLEAALPQYGISQADIIMEMPVEGGITRLMALYSDYRRVPNVCSVRSCRYYFPVFAKGFDAVYFCYGSNELLGTPMLEKSGIDYIDGNTLSDELVFQRDERRLELYSPEHTVYLKGTSMSEVFEKYGFRKQLTGESNKTAFNFSDEEEKFLFECRQISGSFSSSYFSEFVFNPQSKAYFKTHNGEKHIDAVTGEQLNFKNVFLLEADVGIYGDTNLVEIDWHSGTGYYATNGTVEEITWKKVSESSPLEFYTRLGEQLKINKGKSYIGIGVGDITMSGSQETSKSE